MNVGLVVLAAAVGYALWSSTRRAGPPAPTRGSALGIAAESAQADAASRSGVGRGEISVSEQYPTAGGFWIVLAVRDRRYDYSADPSGRITFAGFQ